ncbi:elongation factor P [bacterium]|nr:elongation factor P [bacterium]|tara:strand:+ start:1595 stop:2170 length:576 start_codon:yes stop_codon:yes gene_type:complete
MAKLQYNQIVQKKTVIMDDDPWVVLSNSISKKDRQKASNNVKMKNLRTGATVDRTFHQADVLEEADMEKREVKYLYNNRGEYWFCAPDNPGDRFSLEAELVGDLADFVTENTIVQATVFNEQIIGVLTPIKVELKVKEASDAVKGNTSSGATKEVTLETGYLIQVPQFINQGDVISVNTETGEYSERVEKA